MDTSRDQQPRSDEQLSDLQEPGADDAAVKGGVLTSPSIGTSSLTLKSETISNLTDRSKLQISTTVLDNNRNIGTP